MAMLRRLSNLFRGPSLQREIEAELRSHTEMRIEDNLAAGMSPEQARRDALLRFGNAKATYFPTGRLTRLLALHVIRAAS
jgi:macrolide transport system ATP-binding/permease protein